MHEFLEKLRELDGGYAACALGLDMVNLSGETRPDSVADAPVKSAMDSRVEESEEAGKLPIVRARMVKY